MLYAAFDRCLRELQAHDDERIGVAVSGGRDSMCLVDVARRRLGRRAVVLHVDHGVRASSAQDAAFVQQAAEAHGLEFHLGRLEGVRNDEASLREGRYGELERLRVAADLRWVLLGHHRDDQAETLLMRLLTRGRLEAMPVRRGPFVRPFLRVSSNMLERHALSSGLDWRDDLSNRDPRWLRNRLRRELIPLIERSYRPGFRRRLVAQLDDERGFRARLTDWPAPVGANAAVFDADQVKAPCYRPISANDSWEAELGAAFEVLKGQGAWIVADGARLLWAQGFVARDMAPDGATERAWIFEWK